MLTVKQLGRKGRFANQLFQYAHLRQRARDAGDTYCCPPWAGQNLFGLDDPPMVKGATDIGFKFPLESQWYDDVLFKSLFQPRAELGHQIGMALLERAQGRPVIGIHLRRGDYGTFRRQSARWAFVTPTRWYLDWLDENWRRYPGAVLFIATDDKDEVLRDFEGLDYFSWLEDDDVYWDFYTLTQCDVLLISNSTFGFAASLLNERAMEFWRPRLGEKKLIPYDPWHAPLVFKDERY